MLHLVGQNPMNSMNQIWNALMILLTFGSTELQRFDWCIQWIHVIAYYKVLYKYRKSINILMLSTNYYVFIILNRKIHRFLIEIIGNLMTLI